MFTIRKSITKDHLFAWFFLKTTIRFSEDILIFLKQAKKATNKEKEKAFCSNTQTKVSKNWIAWRNNMKFFMNLPTCLILVTVLIYISPMSATSILSVSATLDIAIKHQMDLLTNLKRQWIIWQELINSLLQKLKYLNLFDPKILCINRFHLYNIF